MGLIEVKDFENVTGKGVTGKVTNRKVALGNKKLMEQVKATISDDLENKIIAEQKLGKTVSYIAVDGATVGFVSITSESAASRGSVLHQFSENWKMQSYLNVKNPIRPFGVNGHVFFANDTNKDIWVKCCYFPFRIYYL